jgi:aspartyl-tRNA(Asn)/glutamyl-tRNA(Gln) amidotransferase subunit A
MQKSRAEFVDDPGRVRDLASQIAKKRLSAAALLRRYLDRIERIDPHVECWSQVDAERALQTAAERDQEVNQGRVRGPLHGIPVAIKDIIDVEGLPTRANSRSRAGAPPAAGDAEIVLALKTAGAVVLGKVHTTEFAFFDPSPARNPHNLAHTPGGSSSGSAAAVAAGMAPIAIGTQTVASVNRPAAYCGIAAFKPSTRSLSTFGITPLGPSYDTPGFFGFTTEDAVYAYEAVAPAFVSAEGRNRVRKKLVIAIPEDPLLSDAEPEVRAALDGMAEVLGAAGHAIERPRSPIAFERLARIQRSTMAYEAGRALKHLASAPSGTVGEKILALIRDGLAIASATYLDERLEIDATRKTFFGALKADVFLWPATPGAAPAGLGWTGDPKYIGPWTALGGPIVSLPAGLDRNGLPIGCILASRPGADAQMCAWARKIARDCARRAPVGGLALRAS